MFLYVHVTPNHLSRKLRRPWCGGFAIHKFLGQNTVKLMKLCDGQLVKSSINVKRLKKCIDPKIVPKPISAKDVFPDDIDDIAESEIPDDNFDAEQNNESSDNEMSDNESNDDPSSSQPPPTQQDSESKPEEVYQVEKVLDKRKRNRRVEYRVKWKGYDESHNSWVPEKDLNTALHDFIYSNPFHKVKGQSLNC